MAPRMTWLRWLGPMLFGGLLLIALQAVVSPVRAQPAPGMNCAAHLSTPAVKTAAEAQMPCHGPGHCAEAGQCRAGDCGGTLVAPLAPAMAEVPIQLSRAHFSIGRRVAAGATPDFDPPPPRFRA